MENKLIYTNKSVRHYPIQLPYSCFDNKYQQIKLNLPSLSNPSSFIEIIGDRNDYLSDISIDENNGKNKYAFFIDVEATGFHFNNFVTEFAIVLFDLGNGKLIDYIHIYFPDSPYMVWDPQCFSEFWAINPKLYYNTLYYMRTQHLNVAELMDITTQWMLKHCSTKDIQIMTDNPSFDIPALNNLLPLNVSLFTITGKYKKILDVSSWLIGYSALPITIYHPKSVDAALKNLDIDLNDPNNREHLHAIQISEKTCHSALSDAYRLAKTVYHLINLN